MTIRYSTTTEHAIERLEVSVEIDDVQDVSYLDMERNGGGVNDSDPTVRAGARADAIIKSQHGKRWGMVTIIVRSQPDNVVRASLGGVDAWDSFTYRRNEHARERADAYFAEILSDLAWEARAEIAAETGESADALPLVGSAVSAPIDGSELRSMASTAVDWWARP